MKMNKIIIPAAALAMGVALVGSVSSTLAWYQYSTKAQAAFIGTSVGESENLEIRVKNGANDFKWVSNAKNSDIQQLLNGTGTNIIPITPAAAASNTDDGNLAKDAALPTAFYKNVETGVGGFETYGNRQASSENYVKFDLYLRYRQTSYGTGDNGANVDTNLPKAVKLVDLTITDAAGNNGATADLYKAVRVHFSSSNGTTPIHNLYANDGSNNETVSTETFGPLDTDNDGKLDKRLGYEWEDLSQESNLIYGVNNSAQTAFNSNHGVDQLIGVIPSTGDKVLSVTVTIWIEGWQKLSHTTDNNYDKGQADDPTTTEVDESREATDSSIWDPASYANKEFRVGMRFQAYDL